MDDKREKKRKEGNKRIIKDKESKKQMKLRVEEIDKEKRVKFDQKD